MAVAIVRMVACGASSAEHMLELTSLVVGPPELVFTGGTSDGSCDDFDLPDMPARAWRDASGTVTLAASWATSRFSRGPSLDLVKHSCHVVSVSHLWSYASPAKVISCVEQYIETAQPSHTIFCTQRQ